MDKPTSCPKCGGERYRRPSGKPYCSPCAKERWAKYYKATIPYQRKRNKEYRLANLEEVRAKERERGRQRYSGSDPEKGKLRYQWLIMGDVSRQDLIEVFEKDSGCCHYCGDKIKRPCFTPSTPRGFDHKTPRSRGGKHTKKNIVACCATCNKQKANKTYREYMKRLKEMVEMLPDIEHFDRDKYTLDWFEAHEKAAVQLRAALAELEEEK